MQTSLKIPSLKSMSLLCLLFYLSYFMSCGKDRMFLSPFFSLSVRLLAELGLFKKLWMSFHEIFVWSRRSWRHDDPEFPMQKLFSFFFFMLYFIRLFPYTQLSRCVFVTGQIRRRWISCLRERPDLVFPQNRVRHRRRRPRAASMWEMLNQMTHQGKCWNSLSQKQLQTQIW